MYLNSTLGIYSVTHVFLLNNYFIIQNLTLSEFCNLFLLYNADKYDE
jgi:hypothetical protein